MAQRKEYRGTAVELVPDKFYLTSDKYQLIVVEIVTHKKGETRKDKADGSEEWTVEELSFHGGLAQSLRYVLSQMSKGCDSMQAIIDLHERMPVEWAAAIESKSII